MTTAIAHSKFFDYSLDFKNIDFRLHPELYQVGRGEQGVLLVEPYKSEILPHWRFKDPGIAKKSSSKIYKLFLNYKKKKDFVGMDMARKFLQMGFTRARRYANHPSGRKYAPIVTDKKAVDKKPVKEGKIKRTILPTHEDPIKAESAQIFYAKYLLAKNDPIYIEMKKNWPALLMQTASKKTV